MNYDLDFQAVKQGVRKARPLPVELEITRAQEQLWTETRTLLLLTCPAFTHILYTMMNPRKKSDVVLWTKEVPIAATDGVALLLNPERFFTFTLMERVFIVAHEILHCIFNHCGQLYVWQQHGKIGYVDGTFLEFLADPMNRAADYVINAQLIEGKIGHYNKNWLHRPDIKGEDSVVEVYRRLHEEGSGGGGGDQECFDEHLPPGAGGGEDPVEANQKRNETEWRTAVAAAMASAKAQGLLPANLERMFGQLLEPVVDWKDHVQAFFARKVGSGGSDWQHPEEELIARGLSDLLPYDRIVAPGRSGHGVGTVVVVGDTSGSIDYDPGKVGDRFLSEMAGILEELRPKRLVIIWCDAAVHQVDEVEDACDMEHIRCRGVGGGGGTSFVPPFEEVGKMGLEPDALIYLTDGCGTFPEHAPPYPVLWGSITDVKYPFGDVVDLTALVN